MLKNILNWNFYQTITQVGIKDNYFEIKFNSRSQVDDKIAWGLDGGFLSFNSSFVY